METEELAPEEPAGRQLTPFGRVPPVDAIDMLDSAKSQAFFDQLAVRLGWSPLDDKRNQPDTDLLLKICDYGIKQLG